MSTFRRMFSATLAGAFLAAGLSVSTPAQAAPILIKVGTETKAFMSQYEPWKKFKEIMETEGKDRFKVEYYLGGAMGSGAAIFEKVQMGALQMGNGSSCNLTSYLPMLGVLETPFAVMEPMQYLKLYYPGAEGAKGIPNGPFFDEINKQFLKKGARIMHVCPFQTRMLGMNCKNFTPADVAGKKFRSTASVMDRSSIQAFGMSPTTIAWPEVYNALQQGVVDGVGNSIDDIVAMKFFEGLTYFNKVPYNSYNAFSYVNEKFYQSLSKEDRALFDHAWQEAFKHTNATFTAYGDRAIKEMEALGKLTIHTPTAEELALWKAAAKPVIEENINRFPELSKIMMDMLAK